MTRDVLRGVPWGPVLWVSACTGALLGGAAAAPHSVLGIHLIGLGFAAAAAAGAFVLDEPAAAAVDATPYSLAARNAARTTALLVPLAVGVAALLVMNIADASMPFWGLCLQLVGVLAVALAGAGAVRRRRVTPGELVGSTVALGVVGLNIFDPFTRWVALFPVTSDERWGRTLLAWCVAIAAAAVVLRRASRDPLDS